MNGGTGLLMKPRLLPGEDGIWVLLRRKFSLGGLGGCGRGRGRGRGRQAQCPDSKHRDAKMSLGTRLFPISIHQHFQQHLIYLQ